MIITKEKFKELFQPILDYEKEDKHFNKLFEALQSDEYYKVPCEKGNKLFLSYINLVAELCEDKDEWLDYYIWECGLGRDPKEVVIDDVTYLVDSLDSLYLVMYTPSKKQE